MSLAASILYTTVIDFRVAGSFVAWGPCDTLWSSIDGSSSGSHPFSLTWLLPSKSPETQSTSSNEAFLVGVGGQRCHQPFHRFGKLALNSLQEPIFLLLSLTFYLSTGICEKEFCCRFTCSQENNTSTLYSNLQSLNLRSSH